jgi:hypothetical protein
MVWLAAALSGRVKNSGKASDTIPKNRVKFPDYFGYVYQFHIGRVFAKHFPPAVINQSLLTLYLLPINSYTRSLGLRVPVSIFV